MVLSLSGSASDFVSEKSYTFMLDVNASETKTIQLSVPESAEAGDYELVSTASADSKTFSVSTIIKVTTKKAIIAPPPVEEITREKLAGVLSRLSELKSKLTLDAAVAYLGQASKILEEAETALSAGNYDRANLLIEQAEALLKRAEEVSPEGAVPPAEKPSPIGIILIVVLLLVGVLIAFATIPGAEVSKAKKALKLKKSARSFDRLREKLKPKEVSLEELPERPSITKEVKPAGKPPKKPKVEEPEKSKEERRPGMGTNSNKLAKLKGEQRLLEEKLRELRSGKR